MLAASLAVVTTAGDARAQSASANDSAQLLAGTQPSPDSPLAPLTKDRAWQQHASRLKLAELFDRGHAEAIDFGVGYRWRAQSSNLMLAVKTDTAKPETVASTHPDPVSGGAPTTDKAAPAKDNAGVGTDFRTHKPIDRGKVHRSSKHATRDRLVAKTAARSHTSRARAAYAFSQPRAAYTFFWPYWFGAPR